MVTSVIRVESNPRLMSKWTLPWRIVINDKEHVYTVLNIVTGDMGYVHAVCMRFYAD